MYSNKYTKRLSFERVFFFNLIKCSIYSGILIICRMVFCHIFHLLCSAYNGTKHFLGYYLFWYGSWKNPICAYIFNAWKKEDRMTLISAAAKPLIYPMQRWTMFFVVVVVVEWRFSGEFICWKQNWLEQKSSPMVSVVLYMTYRIIIEFIRWLRSFVFIYTAFIFSVTYAVFFLKLKLHFPWYFYSIGLRLKEAFSIFQ